MREVNDTGNVKPVAPNTPSNPPSTDPNHPRADRGTFKEDGKDGAEKNATAGAK